MLNKITYLLLLIERKKILTTTNRYRVNLLLFLILLIAAILWFYLHIHLYFEQTLFIGIPLTLGSLIGLVRSSSKVVSDLETSFIKRLLASSSGTHYLITVGFISIALFYFMTSSIYFEYTDSSDGSSEYEVEVEHQKQPYLKTQKVSSYDRIKGKPYFFKLSRLWNPVEITCRIVKPFGYDSKTITLWPWSKVYLKVPSGFDEREYHIIRLLPDGVMLQKPPRVDVTDKSSCSIEISINNNKYTIDNVLMETIYFGAEEEIIESLINAEPVDKRYNTIRNHLTKIGWDKDPQERARILASSYRICRTKELKPGDEFVIDIKQEIDNNEIQSRGSMQRTVHDIVGIQNFPIKVSEP